METYLPIIKAYLADWIQVTVNNTKYAVALAIAVWLLCTILYSIRIAFLKRQAIASEKAHIEKQNDLNAALNTAQQQMQQIQEELAANTEQMEQAKQFAQKEAERAVKLEEQLTQRNKQVAGIIQSLHTSFDLGERPVPVMGDIKAEGLWQQHDRVINLITTRLQSEQQAKTELQQSYQAETAKRVEKEALLEILQSTLATQTSQLSKLEQALEEQKSILQEQQEKAQQVLSQTLEKHLAELARLTELEQQALDLVNTKQQITQLEEKLNVKDTLITQLEKDKSVEQVKVQAQPAPLMQEKIETIIELPKTEEEVTSAPSNMEEESVSPVKEQTGGVAGKLKGLFGKAKQEPIASEPEPAETRRYEEEIQPMPVEVEEQPETPVKEHTAGVAGKLKGLFGKTKQEPITEEPGSLETKQYEEEIVAVEQAPVSSMKDKYGRIKHYFGDITQQSEETKQNDAVTQPAALQDEQPPVSAVKGGLGKLKNLFGSKQQPEDSNQDIEAIQPAPVEVEQPSVSPVKGQLGKLKNLFSSKPKPEDLKPVEEVIQPAASEVEQSSVSPAKGQLGKLKNLFGKAK
jgi:hypothetical protein